MVACHSRAIAWAQGSQRWDVPGHGSCRQALLWNFVQLGDRRHRTCGAGWQQSPFLGKACHVPTRWGGAHKVIFGCKGDAGTKPCMLCKKQVSEHSGVKDADASGTLTCSLCVEDELIFATDDDMRILSSVWSLTRQWARRRSSQTVNKPWALHTRSMGFFSTTL